MAQFVEVMKAAHRMCNSYMDCQDGCPLYNEGGKPSCDLDVGCLDVDNLEYVRDEVLKWAEAHPEPKYPTWIEWQKSTFPEAQKTIYPCNFTTLKSDTCYQIGCHECLNQPIPADIAKKLGIKPIDGGTL